METLRLHGEILLEQAGHPGVNLILDAPWGFALWGFETLPKPCLILTQSPSNHYLQDLLERNPLGLLATPVGPEEVIQTLQRIAQGKPQYRLPPLTSLSLTPRERQVLRWVALGWSNDQIANRLGVGKRTVQNWISALGEKLQAENRVQLAYVYWGLSDYFKPWGI